MPLMRVLFLGYAVPAGATDGLSGASVAGNRMQLGLIGALTAEGIDVDAITVAPIATFPSDPCLRARNTILDLGGAQRSTSVPFINLPVAKQITQIFSVLRAGMKLTRRNRYDYVITFNMFPQVGLPGRWICRHFRIPLICILADPPIDHLSERQGLSKTLMRAYYAWTSKLLRSCDGVIALNEAAAERYTPQAWRIVMDGAIDANLVRHPARRSQTVAKHVVFTGALTEYNGIRELIAAMGLVRSRDVILDIYGGGPLAGAARDAARENANINYHGVVGGDHVLTIQSDGFLLINPRRVADPMSQLTFPSKILEYMLSGTPVLTTRLNGFSEEYDGKLYFTHDGTARAIADSIDELARMPDADLRATAARARDFVRHERSWEARGAMIHQFLQRGPR